MHNNYYFLRQLTSQLRHQLQGFTLVSCFSQNKDELVMELNNARASFFIKATLSSDFCCLSFPKEFHRARKNSVDLFGEAILKKVIAIRQFENERCFLLELEDDLGLLFKMHGNRANVLLTEGERVQHLFRNHLVSDLELNLTALDRTIAWNAEDYAAARREYFTWGKWVWEFLETEKKIQTLTKAEQTQVLSETLAQLETPDYFIVERDGRLQFSLLPFGNIKKSHQTPLDAINDFFYLHSSSEALHLEKLQLQKKIREKIGNGDAYLRKSRAKLSDIQNDHHYQEWADLIMAHLHELPIGTAEITLESFYTQQPITIKLKKDLNAQKNAELFYRKSKNQQIEIDQLNKSILQKENELQTWNECLLKLESENDLKALRHLAEHYGLHKKSAQISEVLPYHEFEHQGFKIWVGRNAESNDELTLKLAYKEDLWLHAKDVAGSHVIIKHQSGKKFPKDVVERAAQLAAYNSKRKTDTLCPVTVTPKKFVRKRKGDPAGMVIVEREEVILVEPRL